MVIQVFSDVCFDELGRGVSVAAPALDDVLALPDKEEWASLSTCPV
jgi:hypothetical protein